MPELIIIFSVLFGFLCFKNFNLGIYLSFLLLPSYRVQFDILGFPMNLLSIIVWIIVFVFFVKNIKKIPNLFRNFKQNITTNSFFKNFRWPISIILITSYIAIFYSSSQIKALGIFKSYFLECLFFFIILAFTITTKKQFKNIIYSLGILSILIFILGLYQKLTGDFAFNTNDIIEKGRITTFFGYPNANGLILVPIFFLNLLNLFEDKKIYLRIFNILVFILIIFAIFWSKSESAIIAIISGLIIFASFKFFNNRKYFIFVVSCILLISFSFPFLIKAPNKIDEPNTKIYSIKEKLLLQDLSGQIRRQMYKETIDFIKDNPIKGAGLVGYQEKIVNYHKFDYIEIFLYPHNIFLNFWVTLGIFGLIGFVCLIIEFMRICIKSYFNNSKEQIFILLTMLAVVIQGIVEVPYFKNDLSIIWWFIILGCLLFRTEK
ncbi:MAG: O-antigen ligase family protein [Patescibacteria group bacterium]|nr:O-antigen ligase family protein [Patescibacteria group bacterium]